MSQPERSAGGPPLTIDTSTGAQPQEPKPPRKQTRWALFGRAHDRSDSSANSIDQYKDDDPPPTEKWSLGILNDKRTEEVPGTILLLSSNRNEPLGLRHQPEKVSASSLPSPYPKPRPSSLRSFPAEKKTTKDGRIILNPQPEDTPNDPLNWPTWRRDCALLSLGFYCMIGGGTTPILAAAYNNVSAAYNVSSQKVALTTGLYMMGLGVGSVIASPSAILFGKRPIYLFGSILFILSSIWCAKSPNYGSLAAARVFQGIAVSPVECLPSATIAEIFFLHERAFRVGIYTLLLLGGKNIIPLVSAAITQGLGWRWIFWMVAIVVGLCFFLLFLFVPETFWDRTPRPKARRPVVTRSFSNLFHHALHHSKSQTEMEKARTSEAPLPLTPKQERLHRHNVEFVLDHDEIAVDNTIEANNGQSRDLGMPALSDFLPSDGISRSLRADATLTPLLNSLNSPFYFIENNDVGYFNQQIASTEAQPPDPAHPDPTGPQSTTDTEHARPEPVYLRSNPGSGVMTPDAPRTPHETDLVMHQNRSQTDFEAPKPMRYTTNLRQRPAKTFVQTLKPWNGRLTHASWFRVMLRPFVLYTYPSVLWSALVYSLSVGWLIVLSESVAKIYRNKDTYNFSAIGTGLVYISPFVGGILGTAVAGKVSDVIVKTMSRRNGGVYEPEFRLVMAIPIAISTAIGLMGFGWSADEHDKWIVPTIFFGVISFGCSLGSTTSITFCVDSYRQYAGEALVTLNFSKNIFHGLVFSLFFVDWLDSDGPKKVFQTIGGIQIACMLTSIPMYIYGKRARMWTVRMNFMAKL